MHSRIASLPRKFIEDPSAGAKADWEEAQQLLKYQMLSMAENKRFFLKQKYFLEGESAGHLLATIVKSQQGSSHVARLVKEDGTEVMEGKDILDTFSCYYKPLYSSRSEGQTEGLAHCLDQISMPRISTESRQMLEQPLTLSELEQALQLSPNDWAPC